MAGIFKRFAQTLFGQRQRRLSIQEQAAADREKRAHVLAQRAAQAQMTGEQQAQAARHRQQVAKARGDKPAFAQAVADELKALDFARRQQREREEQAQREKQAKLDKEQAVRQAEKQRAGARVVLLKLRKDIVQQGTAWPFPGPKPVAPKVYKNVKSGLGDLPDEDSFLIGVKYSAFASSNVVALQFDPRNGGDLYIQFKKKGWYAYPRVGQAFALQMYAYASKGVAVWDQIRVRGTNPRLPSPPAPTRKQFIRGKAPPADLPLNSSAASVGAAGGLI